MALGNLAKGERCKAAVVAAGGIEAALRAMAEHNGAAAVQENGCVFLISLMIGSKPRQEAITAAGGIETVLRAMEAHGDSEAVQLQACGTLWAVSESRSGRQKSPRPRRAPSHLARKTGLRGQRGSGESS
jgi:hypothetical protein